MAAVRRLTSMPSDWMAMYRTKRERLKRTRKLTRACMTALKTRQMPPARLIATMLDSPERTARAKRPR